MQYETRIPDFTIRLAAVEDVPIILMFIRGLAEYEKLLHEVVATEALAAVCRAALPGPPRPDARLSRAAGAAAAACP